LNHELITLVSRQRVGGAEMFSLYLPIVTHPSPTNSMCERCQERDRKTNNGNNGRGMKD